MLLSVRATVADALALTLASAGPLRTPQGSHEQPDEVEPAQRRTDQTHRDLEGAKQPLRQKISPAQQERPHGRRGDQRHPSRPAQPARQLLGGADFLAQRLLSPFQIPVGLVSAAVGGLYLVWLLMAPLGRAERAG